MKAVRNYILVSYEEPKETTKNGLYVPTGTNLNATDILIKGTVINKGKDVTEEIEINKEILYNKNAITKIPECKDKVLIRQEDVYSILK